MKAPPRTTRFSDFIRNARSDEKKKLYMIVLKKATDDQIETLRKYIAILESAGKNYE